ncbi:MAG TPA: hypothetical protein VL461_02310 [Dictyobacter sp.]|jgi:homoserine dehydrogenase|nr:hypothetical protein [Dictyobacter sp.]
MGTTYNVCIIGMGNVGRALVKLFQDKTRELQERYDISWRLTGVASRRIGWIVDADGLQSDAILAGQYPQTAVQAGPEYVREWLQAAQADVLFELSSLNVETGQPAIDYLHAALEHGAHAITANKGPVVHAYHALQQFAQEQHKSFYCEAAVMGGVPMFSLFRHSLPAANILRFRGIVNSTSNVIIQQMEQGSSFEDAIRTAQEMGIAETDPSADIDGWDATVKVFAIAKVLMGASLTLSDVERQGIRQLTQDEVQQARAAGTPYKLVAQIERGEDGAVRASVRPERVAANDALATTDGGSMRASFDLDVLPGLTIGIDLPDDNEVGPAVTAYDVFADFLRAVGV